MKVVQINSVCGKGSTGKICLAISKILSEKKVENYIIYSLGENDYPLAIKVGGNFRSKIQALKSRIMGNYGFDSKHETRKMIRQLEIIKPDIIHLHNIHSHNVDLKTLFEYIKERKIKTVWTFHDCWAFTAYCPHFDMMGCNKWKKECEKCPQRKQFSWFFDRSKKIFNDKKNLFSDLDLTIVTPSQWLADLVKQSFLKDYPVKVINNGIDLSVFKPTESDFRKKYNIAENKFILLGVAFGWGESKGLDVFTELSKRLDSEKYQIVLVGTDDNTDKLLPDNVITIHRTQNQRELAEIYTAADLFVNPTRVDNFPTVNIEAIACGTPVVTFNTGGSPECIDDTCGSVVDCNDIDALEHEIERIYTEKPYSSEACLNRAKEFDMNSKFYEYIKIYNLFGKIR